MRGRAAACLAVRLRGAVARKETMDMPTRTGEAEWRGDLINGKGTVKVGSGSFEGTYDWRSRSADGAGTNPEELLGAAHAGCFSMALSAGLAKAGFTPTRVS